MKKSIIPILSFVLLACLITSCEAYKGDDYRTQAYPLSAEQIAREKLMLNNDYNFENVLAHTLPSGETRLTIFSAPVENSKNIILPLKNSEYTGMESYVKKQLPEIWSSENPIRISDIGNFLELYPADEGKYTAVQKKSVNAFGQSRDAVIYKDVFGLENDLTCYLTSFGINTEIVLNKIPPQNTFEFQVKLYNSVADPESPDYTLFRTLVNGEEVGDAKRLIYTPLVVDRNKKWNFTNQTQVTQSADDENMYTVKFIIDENFLQDKATQYPVTLNQSFYLNKPKQPDTSAYKNTGDTLRHYLSPYLLLGDSGLKGEGWTYIRYETLNLMNIPEDKIVSAKYVFRNLFDLPGEALIGAYAVTSEWCSINTRWINRPDFDEKPVSQTVVKKAGNYELDITLLFREMIKSKQNPSPMYTVSRGFMIRCDTPVSDLILASGDNGLFSPCLEVVIAP